MSADRTVSPSALHECVILVVDDEYANVRLLARVLSRAGFTRVHTTTDPKQTLALFAQHDADLILLDLYMPGMDGFAVLEALRAHVSPAEYLPILAITGDDSSETRQRVLSAGAKDFLGKPFQPSEVVVRVENLLTTRMLHRSLRQQNDVLEQNVRERTAELELALAAAESASRAKSRFLATMSHELRTPLNAVIGFARQLLRNKAGNLLPQDIAFLQRISENGSQLLSIISDILELARLQTESVPVEPAPVSLDELIRGVVDEIRPALQSGVTARLSIPARLTPVTTDEAKLRRVILSLARNAAKFTAQGTVTIGVVADREGQPLRVDVVDTGVGIAHDRIGAVFDTFEQADNTTTRQFGGTGLGLAISRTLSDLLGYRLVAVSDVGVGSAFSLFLAPDARRPASFREVTAFHADAPPAWT